MTDWLIDQIKNINFSTVLISITASGVWKEVRDWLSQRNLQAQQAAFQKDLEIMKVKCQQEIQAHYFQTQFKVTSLYNVYPQLMKSFKETEGLIHQFFDNPDKWEKEIHSSCFALTEKLAYHLLFLDDELRHLCIEAKDKVTIEIWDGQQLDKNNKKLFCDDISQRVDNIEKMMRARLMDK